MIRSPKKVGSVGSRYALPSSAFPSNAETYLRAPTRKPRAIRKEKNRQHQIKSRGVVCNIGALIIRIGFGRHIILSLISRSLHTGIGYYLGPYCRTSPGRQLLRSGLKKIAVTGTGSRQVGSRVGI